MKVYNTESKPIKCWTEYIEDGALEQAKNLANLPFTFKHVAIMPDVHQGYGMPIGGVLATRGVVIPNAVGVDIGCGMSTIKTSLTDISIDQIKKIFGGSEENKGGIRASVPVGMNHHKKDQEWDGFDRAPKLAIIQEQIDKARKQLGTLGGGNHFIEIQKGSDGFIWIMVHSGSRNFGYQIAKYYNKLAQELCKKWFSNIPEPKGEDGLAFLPIDSNEGRDYLSAMNYALDFAYANRSKMLNIISDCFLQVLDCNFLEEINIHHNYARMENHFGSNVMVHRKGAVSAKEGEIGIIPGSQGTKSYITKGLGNKESFESCSHGAGRKMSRTEAQKTLNLEEQKGILDNAGVVHAIRGNKDLDEAPGAYKNISEVMMFQSDLVLPTVELMPLAVVKG
jgi:tRNA-splicing ligase RtcB